MIRQLQSLNLDERRSAAMLFLYGFGNAAAYVIARTVADSVFLSRQGPENLPFVYLESAVAVTLISAAYGRSVAGTSSQRSVITTLLLLSLSSSIVPQLIDLNASWPLQVVYLMAQVRGSLGTIQYTLLLNRQFADRQPERVVGLIGLGATLAGFLVGIGIGFLVESIELASVMYVAAGIDVITVIPVLLLPKVRRSQSDEVRQQANTIPDPKSQTDETLSPIEKKFTICVAALVACSVIAATLVEFLWKVAAANSFTRDELALAKYFGDFYAVVYPITGLLQMFATAFILKHRGLLTGLLLFPAAMLTTTLTAAFAVSQRAMLIAFTLAKGSDILKRSMNDPSVQLLYGPIRPSARHQVITWVAGITKPLAEAAAGLSLVVMTPLIEDRAICLLTTVIIVAWLLLDIRVFRLFTHLNRQCGDHPDG